MLSEKKKNDDDIATLSAVSKATSKKYLDDTGLGHLSSLIISFVRNYASPKTHNHDGVYAKSSHNHSASNITSGTLPVGRGGTGASSSKGAQYNIMNDILEGTVNASDSDVFILKHHTPSATDGALLTRSAAQVWAWIKSKCDGLYQPRGSYASSSHTHTIANVSNLQSTLDSKASVSHTHSNATATASGFMSNADKSKLDGVSTGANKTIVDASFSVTSINPVQNKVVKAALDAKASSSHTHTTAQVTGLDSALAGKASTSHNHNGVYAPSSHSHSADNITSGTLPIGRGGTGATSARAAEYNIMSQTRLVDSVITDNDYFVGLSTTPNTTSGATYKRTAASVWNYIKSKTSALYLPLTGGTVTGLLKTPGGTMVHNANGTSGTVGYVNIAEFNLAGTTYQNMPIQLDVFRRRMSMATRLYIWFDPVASSDPAIAHLGYEGAGTDTDFYIYKSATSTWQLYIKKTEGYDNIGIAEYKTNFSYALHKITFKDVLVSSVPSGAIAGKYCDAMRATTIKDVGDGRTLKMNYSANDLTNAERFAVWNGNTLQSMHKNAVRGVIGAAPASHSHSASNITSGTLPVSRGGTGCTNLVDSANSMMDSLTVGAVTPTDNDYVISQVAGSGVVHKKPMSALWTWIKSKCDAIYQAKGSYAAASHTHNSIKDVGDGRDITFNYSADGMQDANWFAVWNGSELKSMSKQQMKSSLGISSSGGVNLGKLMYPVGAVYISWSSTSPASIFGGSWVAITGRFPYFNAGTSTGGSNSHTLSINEMPSHSHSLGLVYGKDWNVNYWNWSVGSSNQYTSGQSSGSVGGSKPHNNMPAYQTLYAWRRTG